MENENFRDLDIDLPAQRLVNQRPFQIIGILLVIIILFIAGCSYFTARKNAALSKEQRREN